MLAIQFIVFSIINLWLIALVVTVIASWLISFGIVNPHNQFVDAILRTCYAVTEPVLAPIRRFLPDLGGLDITPIIGFIGAEALKIFLRAYIFGPAVSSGF